MITRIDHVSIAVRDYERALAFFTEVLGARSCQGADDASMKYHWQLLSLGDLSRLELISPTGAGSFLDGFLKNREGGVHHISMQTDDLQRAMEILDGRHVPYFGHREYRGAYWKEIFIHPRDAFGVLVQIAEFNADDWLCNSLKLPAGEKWRVAKTADGCELRIAHPGGGTVSITLAADEAARLANDLLAASRL